MNFAHKIQCFRNCLFYHPHSSDSGTVPPHPDIGTPPIPLVHIVNRLMIFILNNEKHFLFSSTNITLLKFSKNSVNYIFTYISEVRRKLHFRCKQGVMLLKAEPCLIPLNTEWFTSSLTSIFSSYFFE